MTGGNLLLVGDPHGRFDEIRRAVERERPEAVVLVGDQTPESEGELLDLESLAPVYYLIGNHDTDQARFLTAHDALAAKGRNLHGRVVALAGWRIAGLGGIFRGRVWMPGQEPRYRSRRACRADTKPRFRFREGPALRHWSSIFPEDFEALERQQADLLVTHEAPESHRYGFRAIGDLGRSMGARWLVHGHHHTAYTAAIEGGATVIGLGYGFDRDGRQVFESNA